MEEKANGDRRAGEATKTLVLTSIQTIFRFVFVTAMGAIIADGALNWGVLRDLNGSMGRMVTWQAEHDKQYDELRHTVDMQGMMLNTSKEKVDELRALKDRLRVAEQTLGIIQATTKR